jgi:hypothetical protein
MVLFSKKYDLKNMEFLPGCRISDRFVVGVKKCTKRLEYICRIGYLETGGRNGGVPCRKKHCTVVGMEKT